MQLHASGVALAGSTAEALGCRIELLGGRSSRRAPARSIARRARGLEFAAPPAGDGRRVERLDDVTAQLARAKALRLTARLDAALDQANFALEARTLDVGPDNHVLVPIWQELGEIELAREQWSSAERAFRRGLELFDETQVVPERQAPLLFGLAQSLLS